MSASDGRGILGPDWTGGVDPAEWVRLQRDAHNPCVCGHAADDHTGRYGDCQARCLCEDCSPDTRNECWCAGYRPPPERKVIGT